MSEEEEEELVLGLIGAVSYIISGKELQSIR